MWLVWAILAAIFVVGEIFTAGFFLLWLGVGAAAAALLAYLGLVPAYQWGAFTVVSGVLVILSRKFAQKVTKESPEKVGADRVIGRTGVVLERIDPETDSGRVRVDKEEWRAESIGGDAIEEGEKVEVVGISGAHLIVRRNISPRNNSPLGVTKEV
ncbi:MAG TPA: NfeD family protein [Candidatus Latescibacteria bacterium]|nr:NfeD family protein [Candidatus Latescibacterota bacterium]